MATTQEKVQRELHRLAIVGVYLEQSDEDASWALDTALPRPLAQQLCARLTARGIECDWAHNDLDSELVWVYVTVEDIAS